MRNPIQISNEEKESIRNSHSSFYNGYATGNVPSNLQPLRVDNSVKDHNGITVDNKGNVKQYTNHRVNEAETNDSDNLNYNVLLGYAMGMSKTLWAEPNKDIDLIGALKELKLYYLDLRNGKTPMVLSVPAEAAKNTVEKLVSELPNESLTSLEKIGAGLKTLSEMDISDEESSYDFDSEGPEQFDSSYSDESYGMDIDSIMQMFGDDMSCDDVNDEEGMMDADLDGKEMYDNEESAYDFDSQGGNAEVYGEEDGSDLDEDYLDESVKKNKKYINEMFNRLKKYN
tara:strand:- start:2320 stop:3174 length:855 start_codon:yes stop_codon:yes gene_type:complete